MKRVFGQMLVWASFGGEALHCEPPGTPLLSPIQLLQGRAHPSLSESTYETAQRPLIYNLIKKKKNNTKDCKR